MKRKKSVFWRLMLTILILILSVDASVAVIAYKAIYDTAYERSISAVRHSAEYLRDLCAYADFDDEDTISAFSKSFDIICNEVGMTYIYLEEVAPDRNSEKYLAIGFGEDAADEAKQTRFAGVTVKGKINQAQLAALDGDEENNVLNVDNQFGDTLICYLRITTFSDYETRAFKDFDKDILVGAEYSMAQIIRAFHRRFNGVLALTFIISVVVAVLLSCVLYRMICRHVIKISARMKSFIEDYDRGITPLEVKGAYEFAEMSRSFNKMAENIGSYLDNITELNREKHMRGAELDIARSIQQGLLRGIHYNGEGFTVEARMIAAREVGGDLYDYQVLEDGRVFMAVADVSGKGVSAALFMSRAVTLLNMYAKLGYSPAQLLAEYNNTLEGQNPEMLFITTFAAFYDPKTATLTYSNAGHNNPYVISDSLIPLDKAHGTAAGIFPGCEYEEASVKLKEGDCVFLYTDGVSEAQNASGALFSEEALEKVLGESAGGDGEAVVNRVFCALEDFSGGAEQSDDITILVFRSEKQAFSRTLHLKAQSEELPVITEALSELPGVSPETLMQLELIAEEMFVNICSYAYGDGQGEVTLEISVTDRVTLTFTDSGKPFDPTGGVLRIEDYDHDEAVGGLGRFITFTVADGYDYRYENGKNILTIIKNL